MEREYRRREVVPKKKEKGFKTKIIGQCLVSLMFVFCLFSFKSINNKTSDVFIKSIKSQLYYTVDYKTAAKKIVLKVNEFKNTKLKDNKNNEPDKNFKQPTSTDKII